MYDYYGVYRACRDAAWRCQIDFRICSLPVKLITVAHLAGISVKKNSEVHELRKGETGAGINIDGRWIIVYDDTLDAPRARMVIAHELGHIFLGHEYKYGEWRFRTGSGKLKSEREADMFAVRLLSPACVLHELGVTGAADIEKLCEVPTDIAVLRAKRMKMLEARQSYYSSALEAKVASGFRPFIEFKKAIDAKNTETE